MRCRVDLVREALRGLGLALGAILLITGPFFAALSLWLGPLLFALGLFLLLASRRLATRWCLGEGRLCLGRRCYDLARLKGYEVRSVGLGFCREARLYLVFEDGSVPFPTAVEEAHRLARELFGEVPVVLQSPRVEDEPAKPNRWDDLEHGLIPVVGYFAVGLVHRVATQAGWGVALLVALGMVLLGVQLLCLYGRLRAPR